MEESVPREKKLHLVCHFNLPRKNDDFLIRDTVLAFDGKNQHTHTHIFSIEQPEEASVGTPGGSSISVSYNRMNEVRLSMNASELEQVTATLFSHLIFRSFSALCTFDVGSVCVCARVGSLKFPSPDFILRSQLLRWRAFLNAIFFSAAAISFEQ